MYGLSKFLHLRLQGANIDTPTKNLGDLFGTSKGTVQTTSTSAPWQPQQKYLTNLFSRADQLYKSQPTPNLGLLNQAQGLTSDTLSGKFLDPYQNPHFGGALQQALGDVRSAINSNFRGDNFGSSAHQEWLGKGLMGAAMPMLANQYNMERGNQMSAIGAAPGLSASSAQLPWLPLQNYQQAVSGNFGGTQTSEQPYYVNNTANTLGLGLGALSLLGTGGLGGKLIGSMIPKPVVLGR